jgi:hypothetical protein
VVIIPVMILKLQLEVSSPDPNVIIRSSPIKLTKTNDITKIKGWKGKSFVTATCEGMNDDSEFHKTNFDWYQLFVNLIPQAREFVISDVKTLSEVLEDLNSFILPRNLLYLCNEENDSKQILDYKNKCDPEKVYVLQESNVATSSRAYFTLHVVKDCLRKLMFIVETKASYVVIKEQNHEISICKDIVM